MCPLIRHPNLMSLKDGREGAQGVQMMAGKNVCVCWGGGGGSFGARSLEEKLEGW